MSLIQEALRKRDEELGRTEGKIPPRIVLPGAISPDASEKPEVEHKPKSRTHLWVSLTVLLAVGLMITLILLGWFVYRFTPLLDSLKVQLAREEKPAVAPPAIDQPTTTTPELPVTTRLLPQAPTTPSPPPVVSPERQEAAVAFREAGPPKPALEDHAPKPVSPAGRSVALPEISEPDQVPPTSRSTPPPAPSRAGAPSEAGVKSSVPVAAVPVAMPAKTSTWPRLTLNGVMARGGPGRGSAIINGTMIEVGEKIEGARLVEVQPNGIVVEYLGSTQFLRVGQSTY